jgi:hypothetical protein
VEIKNKIKQDEHTFAQKGNLRAHIKVKCVLILQRLGIKSINFYSCPYICPTFGFCSIAYVSLDA